jgi:hypothetical protein
MKILEAIKTRSKLPPLHLVQALYKDTKRVPKASFFFAKKSN